MEWIDRLLAHDTLTPAATAGGGDPLPAQVAALSAQQESAWRELSEARALWMETRYREIALGPFSVLLQHNPSRALSVAAPVDPESIRRRPCFLCSGNMPAAERGLPLDDGYALFLNPFPIFYPHPVIIHREHRPQAVGPALPAMLSVSRQLAGSYTLLYNGPACGASAPDHLHYQAIPRFSTALEADVRHLDRLPWLAPWRREFPTSGAVAAFTIREYARSVLVLRSPDEVVLLKAFARVLDNLPPGPAPGGEPLLNLLVWYEPDGWIVCLFPRTRHRPLAYTRGDGPGVMISPGAIDLAGMLVIPRGGDFESLDAVAVRSIFQEVCLPEEQLPALLRGISRPVARAGADRAAPLAGSPAVIPELDGDAAAANGSPGETRLEAAPSFRVEPLLRVGLMERQSEVEFQLAGAWAAGTRPLPAGLYRVIPDGGRLKLHWPGGGITTEGSPLVMDPGASPESCFWLRGVTIGIDFHWQRQEDQCFRGALELAVTAAGTVGVRNRVPLEEYLASVISSEMRADAPPEFLRAHAVISRGWVLAQLAGQGRGGELPPAAYPPLPGRVWTWTDRERHEEFDICADDHCQRYQGITRVFRDDVRRAVAATRGQVLAGAAGICDTRFAKCCGGMSESFRTAWSDINRPGLAPVRDWTGVSGPTGPLTVESNARAWIRERPPAFCGTRDPELLRRILPDFDLETGEFYRWELVRGREELEALIAAKTGWNPGALTAIVPVQRGFSGRICRLLLAGERGRLLLGKELEIRRVLSPTHLYSSAFLAEGEGSGRYPDRFRFRGAGWGHGVGLCQIGAAAMAWEGANHRSILAHYFPGTRLTRWYA